MRDSDRPRADTHKLKIKTKAYENYNNFDMPLV